MSGDPPPSNVAPTQALYLDEAATRQELARVFDICSGCRRCTELCSAFPTLFGLLDGTDTGAADLMTPAEQDDVVTRCFQCSLCAIDCPYARGRHEAAVDMPSLMLRAAAMRRANGHQPIGERIALRRLRTSPFTIGSRTATLGIEPLLETTRVRAPGRRTRFTTWFRRRRSTTGRMDPHSRPSVVVMATCAVEYQRPAIGRALVRVLEHHDIGVEIADIACCGAPWLYSGALDEFGAIARRVTARLNEVAEPDAHIIVGESSCAAVIRDHYPSAVGSTEAGAVADRVVDIVEYLALLESDGRLKTEFSGDVPETVVCHLACRTRSTELGDRTLALLALTGAQITAVTGCSGAGPPSSIDHGDPAIRHRHARELGDGLNETAAETTVGTCCRADLVIAERAAREPIHPVEYLASAYGLGDG